MDAMRRGPASTAQTATAADPAAPPASYPGSTAALLWEVRLAWAGAALLPLPAVMVTSPASSADVGCMYLGVACAWLATEILRRGGFPLTHREWRLKARAACMAIVGVVALFVTMGYAAGAQSRIPFVVLAALSATPALGLVPWLVLRVREPYLAIMLGAMILVAAKLAACVVARIVYGPDFLEQGYVAGDWETAKLMITLFWTLTVLCSVAGLIAVGRKFRRTSGVPVT